MRSLRQVVQKDVALRPRAAVDLRHLPPQAHAARVTPERLKESRQSLPATPTAYREAQQVRAQSLAIGGDARQSPRTIPPRPRAQSSLAQEEE